MSDWESKRDEREESEERKIVAVEKAKNEWIMRECADIGSGEEAVDLRDLAPEVQRIGLGLPKAHPIHEKMESSGVGRGEVRELVRDFSSVEILPVCLSDAPYDNDDLDLRMKTFF